MLDPVPTLVLYAQTWDCQELFAAIGQIVLKARRRLYSSASTIVKYFLHNCKINRLTSLCGCGRIWQIVANLGQNAANLRKFWQVRCKKHLTAAISYAAPRNKFMLGVRQKLFDIGNRSLYNFYKSEELYERYSIRSL